MLKSGFFLRTWQRQSVDDSTMHCNVQTADLCTVDSLYFHIVVLLYSPILLYWIVYISRAQFQMFSVQAGHIIDFAVC